MSDASSKPNDEPLADAAAQPGGASKTTNAPSTAAASTEMTPAQLAEAKEYGQRELVCGLLDKVLDVAFLTVMAFALAVPLERWLSPRLPGPTAVLAAIFVITTLAHIAVSFPLSFYSGHVLEHRYGLSRLSLGGWFWRYAKQNALVLVFGIVMFTLLYWIIWLVGSWWWLAAAAGFFVVAIVMGQLMPVVILPLFYKIERLDNPDLAARMKRLSEGTGLSIEGVYRMGMSEETVKANAMLAGLGSTRRVLMGDTLLDQFSGDEIEVIFAHEIGHHVFRHIRKMIVTGAIYSAVGFWVCNLVLLTWARSHYGPIDAHDMPPSTLPLLMLVLTVFGTLLEPLQNSISRRYERQCDNYALERTGLRAAYQSAFRKLAILNKDDPAPHPLKVFLFHSHPPIAERLRMAEK